MDPAPSIPWLVLIHQLPPKPSNLRVKTWRRLQELGAISLKNSVYVLPNTDAAREDFEWVLREIRKDGGDASLCEARLVEGLNDGQLRELFSSARGADYRALAAEVRRFAQETFATRTRTLADDARTKATAGVARLRKRLAAVTEIDFFGAPGRQAAEALVLGLEQRLAPAHHPKARPHPTGLTIADVRKRTWVTRTGIHIDRIGSAWLIKRFIDPQATFKFVPARGYTAAPRELRFDMFDAEFTHDGDLCTFEVLVRAFALDDPALHAVAEVVHDVDLKEARFDREETTGFDHLIAGLAWAHGDDATRLEHGTVVFEALYTYFHRRKGAKS
jgi:hypothetical protein